MNDPKPYASLSSGLLARKGQARPAMRPQGFTGGYAALAGMEDLGWNDMGHAPEPAANIHEAGVDTPTPDVVPQVLVQREQLNSELGAPVRKVQALPPIEEREPLPEETVAPTFVALPAEPLVAPVVEPVAPVASPVTLPVATRAVSVAAAARIARATRHKAKAAFTLRLDQERHLRLRLASAVSGRSAQVLVTEALDAFLQTLPEVEDLASQVPGRAKD